LKYPNRIVVNSTDETASLARKFAASVKEGDVIILNGNLGAGKTFFIKKAGEYFDINNINSPTFSIVNEHNGKIKLNHFDFYRINSVSELYNIGIDDYFSEENSVTFIEWGNLFPEVLPHKRKEILITVNEDYSREFHFEAYE
jgi:tRNA threonylcarbamoyladenosine biosynthesis protein TsaE